MIKKGDIVNLSIPCNDRSCDELDAIKCVNLFSPCKVDYIRKMDHIGLICGIFSIKYPHDCCTVYMKQLCIIKGEWDE